MTNLEKCSELPIEKLDDAQCRAEVILLRSAVMELMGATEQLMKKLTDSDALVASIAGSLASIIVPHVAGDPDGVQRAIANVVLNNVSVINGSVPAQPARH